MRYFCNHARCAEVAVDATGYCAGHRPFAPGIAPRIVRVGTHYELSGGELAPAHANAGSAWCDVHVDAHGFVTGAGTVPLSAWPALFEKTAAGLRVTAVGRALLAAAPEKK